jgi:hypothetical protein
MPQDRGIDVVLDKALGVLGHAEFFEPIRNLLLNRLHVTKLQKSQ